MVDDIQIYKEGHLTFILLPDKVIIKTSLGQTFFLEPRAHFWRRRLNLITTMIQLHEIRNLEELAQYCKTGVAWIPTSVDYEKSVL